MKNNLKNSGDNMPSTGVEISGDMIKWGGGIMAGIIAFFTLKARIMTDMEAMLKLRLDLIHAEIIAVQEHNKQLKLEIDRLLLLVDNKLSEKEHSLLCSNMQQVVTVFNENIQKDVISIKDSLDKKFAVLNNRLDARRSSNGNPNTMHVRTAFSGTDKKEDPCED